LSLTLIIRAFIVKTSMKIFTLIAALIIWHAAATPKVALAVLPPDLVVSAGAQVVGIFSLILAIIVSLAVSVGAFCIVGYQWVKKWSVYIAFGVLGLALVLSNAVFLWVLNSETRTVDVPAEPMPPRTYQEPEQSCDTCVFYSDSLTMFVPDRQSPTVIEIDLNRRQEPNNSFSHYYFLDGVVNGQPLNQYTQFNTTGYNLQPSGYLDAVQKTLAADASVRDMYTGGITTEAGRTYTFSTTELSGDFVTRNTPEYTQFQSPATVTLVSDGVTQEGYVLTEMLHSTDFEKRIFFDGYEALDALTHQFILWDDRGNFYMIDDTAVFSDTPQYPSHSWLLYKNTGTGVTKKGFSTVVTSDESNAWQVTVPDFDQGVIDVSRVMQYKSDPTGRSRYVVAGTITDTTGERTISGVLKIVR